MAPRKVAANTLKPKRNAVYHPGDKIWCLWKGLYYRAKILETGIENDGQYYSIHYWKFAKSWDTVVSDKRIYPVNPHNDRWILIHNKSTRKKLREYKKAHEQILATIKKFKGKSPKETPPYLILNRLDTSNHDRFNMNGSYEGQLNQNSIEIASTSRRDEITNTHSEQIHIDGNDHNNSLLNTLKSATVSFNGHDYTENEAVDLEVNITADASDLKMQEASIAIIVDPGHDIKRIYTASQNNEKNIFEKEITTFCKPEELKNQENNMTHYSIRVSLNGSQKISRFHTSAQLSDIGMNSSDSITVATATFTKQIISDEIATSLSSDNISTSLCIKSENDHESFAIAEKKFMDNKQIKLENDQQYFDSENCVDNKLENDIPKLKKKRRRRKFSDINICVDNDDPIISRYDGRGDMKIEKTPIILESETIYENNMIGTASDPTDGNDINIEEVPSTLPTTVTDTTNDELMININNQSVEVDKISSGHTSNENCSSGNSSPSIPLSHLDDNNGQVLEDDDQYVKHRKVSKKNVKLDEEDRIIYEQFSYDKSYSRAAKVKANEAISQMSKPPVCKDKKNDVKRSKNGKKKDDDQPSESITHIDLKFNNYFLQLYLQDFHLLHDDRCIPVIPSKLTAFDIMYEYTRQASEDLGIFTLLVQIFDQVFHSLIIYHIERLRHIEVTAKNPTVDMAHIYGLPHLARFLYHFPAIMTTIKIAKNVTAHAINFMRGFSYFLEEQKMELTMDLYENTLPEYVRYSYLLMSQSSV